MVNNNNKKMKLTTEFQFYVTKHGLNDVREELDEGYDEINVDEIISTNKYDEPIDCFLSCMLYHVKKKKDKNIKYKKENNKDEAETSYYRLMFLGDTTLRPICLILDDNISKSLVLTFSNNIKIGHVHRIVNPTFEGYFNEMPLLKCDVIVPVVTNPSMYSMKDINISNFQDSRYILSRFRTNQFKIKKILVCDTSCKGPCDSRYGAQCYCVQKKNWDTSTLAFHFMFEDYKDITFMPYISNHMMKMFVHNRVIENQFKINNNPCLRNIRTHVQNQLNNKHITVHAWCVPKKNIDSDYFVLRKIHIARIIVEGEDCIEKYTPPINNNQQILEY